MNRRSPPPKPSVGLYITCAVDFMRPSVAFAAIKLLEEAGCRVEVPPQSCCGQVAYNNGLTVPSRHLARQVIESFSAFDYVVTPSGSCASMLKHHYPKLFQDGDRHCAEACHFAGKVYELTSFLHDVLHYQPSGPRRTDCTQKKVVYHHSCAGLRDLGIRQQPQNLLRNYRGVSATTLDESNTCCGFGGTFCVKFVDIANKMVGDKVELIHKLKPDLLLGGDLTCLLHIAGKLQRQGNTTIEVRHVAEFLADSTETPAIGKAQ